MAVPTTAAVVLAPRRPPPGGGRASMLRAMELSGTAAIISGGASGLGEATARALAAAGSTVVVADLNADRGEAVAAEVGGKFVQTDVADEASVTAAVEVAAGQGAPLPGGHLHGRGDRCLVGDVRLHELAAGLGGDRLAAVGVQVGDDDGAACGGERARRGLAQAACPAGDDCC